MSKKKDEKFSIRITDSGSIHGILQIVNVLILISSVLSFKEIKTIKDLVRDLKEQLSKMLIWLDRAPDGTLYGEMSKKQVEVIKKEAKTVLSWNIIPTEKQLKTRKKNLEEWEELQQQEGERVENPVSVMMDTSFLLSYLTGDDKNSQSSNVVVGYLKTQIKFFDLFLPNFVLLELISKLKQKYPFQKARTEFNRLLGDISDNHILVKEEKLGLINIFDRYQKFSKKKLSSYLKSNDFRIATDGILNGSIILTCDKRMYDGIKKTYKNVYLIDESPKSYTKFINGFEKYKVNEE